MNENKFIPYLLCFAKKVTAFFKMFPHFLILKKKSDNQKDHRFEKERAIIKRSSLFLYERPLFN